MTFSSSLALLKVHISRNILCSQGESFNFTLECVERQKDVTNEQRKQFGGSEEDGNIIVDMVMMIDTSINFLTCHQKMYSIIV